MKYNITPRLKAKVNADKVRKLYDRLEDEAKPYKLAVHRVEPGVYEISIKVNTEDTEYFNNIITSL